jgi:hypothetical protein
MRNHSATQQRHSPYMALVRPRLTDFHGILLGQEEIDFAIPILDEDLPFCVDPFLLWKSPSQQDQALHVALISSFNHIGFLANSGDGDQAVQNLVRASECNEVGLGFSAKRQGARIGQELASRIVSLFTLIPEVKRAGFSHLEEIQMFVDQISRDRISDLTCTFLKSFLIDYTIEQCRRYGIPLTDVEIRDVYDQRSHAFVDSEKVTLPVNPETLRPILLVPKRWLRKAPWITYDDYTEGYFLEKVLRENEDCPSKGEILLFNRYNYGIIQAYIREKERTQADCHNDPLFLPIPVLSAKRKFAAIKKLPSGKDDNVHRKYEHLMCQLMASLLYPHLDFAEEQSRTDSGVLIRDLIFYNNCSVDFLSDIYRSYDSRQIVMELKNVEEINRTHINQLNRYLANEFGRFGVLLTRNELSKAMFRNTVDLWSGQRRCIITITDQDVELMVDVFESKQRTPIEVIKKKFIDFTRACPA